MSSQWLRWNCLSQLAWGVDGAGGADAGAVEEDAHAQGLKALGSDEAQLPVDVIGIPEEDDAGFVVGCAALQPFDALLNRAAEARADLEALLEC